MAIRSASDRLLKIPECAARAGVGRSTVYEWLAAGFLERVVTGSGKKPCVRVWQSELDRYLAQRTIPARRPSGRAA